MRREGNVEKPDERSALLVSRLASLESILNMLLGRVAYLMSLFVKSRHTAKIILIGVGYEKFRDLTPDLVAVGREVVAVS